jgi:hypothetical protein
LIGGDNWPDYAKKNYVNKCSDCLRVEKRREARVYRLNRTEEQIKNRKSTYIKHRERLKLDNPKLYTARQMSGSVSVVPSGVFDGAVIKLSIQADALTKTEFRTIRSSEPFTINGKTGQTLFAKVENGGSNTALDLSVL